MTNRILAAAIGLCLLLQLHLVFVQPINWDEFRFLADIYAYQRGELSAPILTFQVHLFGWLTGLGDEVVQIRIARLVMLALEAGILFFIGAVARRFFSTSAALFAVLCYISFSFVLQHGASFRFDPIITFLMMAAIWLLLRERLRWAAMLLVGLALALAAMVSIKIVFALPIVVAVSLYRLLESEDWRGVFLRLVLTAVSAGAFLALLFWFHVSSLASASSAAAQSHISESYVRMIGETPFFPRFNYFGRSLVENPLHWLLLLLGISGSITAAVRDRAKARHLLVLAFLVPLLCIPFYRNAFPYYYAFVLAFAALLWAAAADRDEIRARIWLPAVLMSALALLHYYLARSEAASNQASVIAAVHRTFPPVPYIDRCSMVASFPQQGLFLSTLMLEAYHRAGRPIMRDHIEQLQPVFLIANSPALIDAMAGRILHPGEYQFLKQDRAVLKNNYLPFWGPIFLAGKRIPATPQGVRTDILVGGAYTIIADVAVSVDGRVHQPGSVVALAQGSHEIRAPSNARQIELRWGDRLGRPVGREPSGPMVGRF